MNAELLPCPLCNGLAVNLSHGISSRKCGLWLGTGTQVHDLGGLIAVWNEREIKKI